MFCRARPCLPPLAPPRCHMPIHLGLVRTWWTHLLLSNKFNSSSKGKRWCSYLSIRYLLSNSWGNLLCKLWDRCWFFSDSWIFLVISSFMIGWLNNHILFYPTNFKRQMNPEKILFYPWKTTLCIFFWRAKTLMYYYNPR